MSKIVTLFLMLLQFTFLSRVTGQTLDFSHDVVPILRTHCIKCHGGKEAKGGFSINTRESILESGHIDLEHVEASDLLKLIQSADVDEQMPPKDQPRLSKDEIAVIRSWIANQLTWEAGFSFAQQSYSPPLRPRRPELPPARNGRTHPIDRILDHDLATRQQPVPGEINDAMFLRRVSLDLVGLLPTPEVIAAYEANTASDKRERYIDELLNDKIAYADHWLTFFNDLLRNDYSGTGFITGGRKQISSWLYQALAQNKPFDQIARELVAPTSDEQRGYIDGIRWRGTVSAGQTVEIQFAQSVAQSFLGLNLKCASCHDSFIDRWTLDEAYSLAAVYSAAPLEVHRCDKPVGRTAQAAWLFPEIGQIDPQKPPAERLQQLSALLTHPENGRFARTIVNRLWYRLMGRGIVHPLDAMQTEPANADLLDYLGTYLVDQHYDLKQVLRHIASSQAYQSQTAHGDQPGDLKYQGPIARRMTAEQFLDSVWQLTATAPAKFDAPVLRADLSDPTLPPVNLQAQWIWNRTDHGAPPEKLLFRKSFKLEKALARSVVLITCDNEFTLYLNGREAARGKEWTQLNSITNNDLFKTGNNDLVVIAANGGDGPNAAGLYCEVKLIFEDGSDLTIATDESWDWSNKIPNPKEGRLGNVSGPWEAAKLVDPVPVWLSTVAPQAEQLMQAALHASQAPVRASLMKNNALMRSLGRPTRDQIVSMRPNELSTLEALDLANEAALSQAFSSGGATLLKSHGQDPKQLVGYIYRHALSRWPTSEEQTAAIEFIGSEPSSEAVQDLLWAVCMLPEFWLVR